MELIEVENNTQSYQVSYPNDWKWINLGNTSLLKARIGWQGLTTAEYLDSGDYLLVTGTDFSNGFIDWENCFYVEAERYIQDRYIQLKPFDVLVTKDGTIGKVAFVSDLVKPATLNSGVFVIRPKQDAYDPQYLYYVLRSNHFADFLSKLTAGSTISHLYQKDFIHYRFPAPSTHIEQRAIAKALNDVDALISNLDKLITKKKAIKQGVMQQLLKSPKQGGKQLDGFKGEWEEKLLGEIGYTYSGLTGKTNSDFENGNSPYISFLNVLKNTVIDTTKFVYVWVSSSENQNMVQQGDMFFNTSSETPDEVGMCAVLLDEVPNLYLNSFCFGYRIKDLTKYDGLFLSYLINSEVGRRLFKTLGQGSTRYNLSKSNFNKVKIELPRSIEEQKAISAILSDFDTEIFNLEKKKTKYLSIKQGMMQELLTGKARLL